MTSAVILFSMMASAPLAATRPDITTVKATVVIIAAEEIRFKDREHKKAVMLRQYSKRGKMQLVEFY
jgi:hypothetical protein